MYTEVRHILGIIENVNVLKLQGTNLCFEHNLISSKTTKTNWPKRAANSTFAEHFSILSLQMTTSGTRYEGFTRDFTGWQQPNCSVRGIGQQCCLRRLIFFGSAHDQPVIQACVCMIYLRLLESDEYWAVREKQIIHLHIIKSKSTQIHNYNYNRSEVNISVRSICSRFPVRAASVSLAENQRSTTPTPHSLLSNTTCPETNVAHSPSHE